MRDQPKITFRMVKELFGLDDHFEPITPDDYREMLDRWKKLVVEARQSGNTLLETQLNNCKAWVLEEMRHADAGKCPKCGAVKARHAKHCGLCARALKQPVNQPCRSNTMRGNEIIQALEAERAEQESVCAAAQSRITQLTVAIDALGGRHHIGANEPQESGPSVCDMVLEAAKKLDGATPGAGFDARTLVAEASTLHPTRHSMIKRGVYNAITVLKNKNLLTLAPGGVRLV